jgi:5-hydroxyisourate hydrolase
MSGITTHVLDTSIGRPAVGVPVHLERANASAQWESIGRAETDVDGRVRTLLPQGAVVSRGVYRLTFDTRSYFARGQTRTFYPQVVVVFEIVEVDAHYHVPLLVSPWGYTTYRGT